MSELEKTQLTSRAKNLGSWLGIELKITLFGVTILHWKYPPTEQSSVELEG